MQNRYQYLLRIVLAVTDIVLLNVAFFLASYFKAIIPGPYDQSLATHYLITCNLIWLFSVKIFGLYEKGTIERVEMIYRATWKSTTSHIALFIFYLAFAKDAAYSREFLVYFYAMFFLGLLISRFTGTIFEAIIIRNFKVRKSVAILGVNSTSKQLATYFRNNQNNFLFEGFLNETDTVFVNDNGDILPAACEQIRLAANNGIKEVYVTMSAQRVAEAPHLILEAEKHCVRLKFLPDLVTSFPVPYTVNYMGDFPVINLRHEPLEDMQNRFKKRILDIAVSLVAIVFILSWLVPVLALIIKWQSPGPVFFRQRRSGRNNEPFWCFKFRSMRVNDESDIRQANKDDDRTTPIGKFMRRTSIDELPQFFNVLLGNMSVVGPRPHMLSHTLEYSGMINQFMLRHFMKPGITGWAQVNGFRGEIKDHSLMESRVEHDIWYMENWSTMLDVKVIFLTVINIMKGEEQAY